MSWRCGRNFSTPIPATTPSRSPRRRAVEGGFLVAQQLLAGADVPNPIYLPLPVIEKADLDGWLKVMPDRLRRGDALHAGVGQGVDRQCQGRQARAVGPQAGHVIV